MITQDESPRPHRQDALAPHVLSPEEVDVVRTDRPFEEADCLHDSRLDYETARLYTGYRSTK